METTTKKTDKYELMLLLTELIWLIKTKLLIALHEIQKCKV